MAVQNPLVATMGMIRANDQKAATLPKWRSQECGAISGNKAMERSKPAKGIDQARLAPAPSKCAALIGAMPPSAKTTPRAENQS